MTNFVTMGDVWRGLVRSWYIVVLAVVIAAGASVGVWAIFPQTYTARAQYTVEPMPVLSTGSSFNTVNMQTETVVATSDRVMELAISKLDSSTTVLDLRESTTVQVPRNSQVLTVEVTAASPRLSAESANAVADAYGEYRKASAQAVVDKSYKDLSAAIARLRALQDSQETTRSERALAQSQLQSLIDQQAELSATPVVPGTLITRASAPSDSDRPSLLIFVVGGVSLGLLVGAGCALLTSRLRESRSHGA